MKAIIRKLVWAMRRVSGLRDDMANFAMFKAMRVKCRFRSLRINGRLLVRNHGTMEIGDGCLFNSGRIYNLIGGDDVCVLVTVDGGTLKIGRGCQISNATMVATVGIELGEDVFVGGGVKIYDTDFHPLDSEQRIKHQDGNTRKKPVHIGSGAFIGASSIILKGVTIGQRAVIGAGSVVARDVGDDEVWAGNPARFIRRMGQQA